MIGRSGDGGGIEEAKLRQLRFLLETLGVFFFWRGIPGNR
jgi:hypothetical protein